MIDNLTLSAAAKIIVSASVNATIDPITASVTAQVGNAFPTISTASWAGQRPATTSR